MRARQLVQWQVERRVLPRRRAAHRGEIFRVLLVARLGLRVIERQHEFVAGGIVDEAARVGPGRTLHALLLVEVPDPHVLQEVVSFRADVNHLAREIADKSLRHDEPKWILPHGLGEVLLVGHLGSRHEFEINRQREDDSDQRAEKNRRR